MEGAKTPPGGQSKSSMAAEQVLREIAALPHDWHGAGAIHPEVLAAIVEVGRGRRLTYSAETGTGKSTLLLSHLSASHKVFTFDDGGSTNSLRQVLHSPLLNSETVEFIVGPTQKTLPAHAFTHPFQLVLLDGPHGYPFPELEYYYFYPQLEENGLLVVDDIHIPTIHRLFEFLREEEMFDFIGCIHTTALFRRNEAALFDPLQDGWWLQGFNKKRFPVSQPSPALAWPQRLKPWLPGPVLSVLRTVRRQFTSHTRRRP